MILLVLVYKQSFQTTHLSQDVGDFLIYLMALQAHQHGLQQMLVEKKMKSMLQYMTQLVISQVLLLVLLDKEHNQ